jgi:hypothetical protein
MDWGLWHETPSPDWIIIALLQTDYYNLTSSGPKEEVVASAEFRGPGDAYDVWHQGRKVYGFESIWEGQFHFVHMALTSPRPRIFKFMLDNNQVDFNITLTVSFWFAHRRGTPEPRSSNGPPADFTRTYNVRQFAKLLGTDPLVGPMHNDPQRDAGEHEFERVSVWQLMDHSEEYGLARLQHKLIVDHLRRNEMWYELGSDIDMEISPDELQIDPEEWE